jgi:ATP/maltotriose-dependent transcriptional regulator MalT
MPLAPPAPPPAHPPAAPAVGKPVGEPTEESPILEMGGITLAPGDRIGPYVYVRPLGSGGMAYVLVARDPGGQLIALKVLKAHRLGSGLGRFRREFRALSRIDHENVIHVEAYGDIHGHPYIAMELVLGTDLHMEIRDLRALPPLERWARVEQVLIDLSRALAHIHARGLVHRDLKPSNILIDKEGRCKLSDFGIVKDLDPGSDPFVSTTLVGTWAYASPEQITGASIDHRSDLYSLGVILYAMLTGRRPFNAKDMAGYLAMHRDQPPRSPREFDPDCPPHLEEICLRLLAKAPRDRLQSAGEIVTRLTRALSPEEPTPEGQWSPPFTGRRAELDRLYDAVSALTAGQGGAFFIEGAEGTGRSRLLALGVARARLIGIGVHQARIGANEGGFEALMRIASAIGRELGTRVPADLNAALLRFARGRGKVGGDLRYQLYDGLREALTDLVAEGPLVIALDDLHHAPAPMAALIGYLVRTLVARDHLPLLVLATARTDTPSPALAGLREGSELGLLPGRVHLGNFDLPTTRELALAVLGPEADSTAIFEETGGNPYFVAEVLAALREGGGTTADLSAGGELDPRMPPRVRSAVAARISELRPAEAALVHGLAVIGREVDVDVLLDIVDESEELALDRIDGLVSKGLLTSRTVGLQTLVDFSQARLAELVYRDLPPPVRSGLHRRVADTLGRHARGNSTVAEAIGEHYRMGGDLARAWRFLAEAAIGMADRAALAEAWRLAERAAPLTSAGQAGLDVATFSRCHRGLLRLRADALYNRGAWAEAEVAHRQLEVAARAVQDHRTAAHAGLDRGGALRRLGQHAAAAALVHRVLEEARDRHDRATIIDSLHRLAIFAWEDGDLDLTERLAGEGLVLATGPDLVASRAEILLALTAVQASRGQLAVATAGLTEAESLLRPLRNKRSSAVVLGNLAELLVWQGRLGEAIRQATAGLSSAGEALFREGEAFILRVRGQARLEAGDLDGADQDLGRSLLLCEELGVASETVATRFMLARLCQRREQVDASLVHIEAGLDRAQAEDPERYEPALRALAARARRQRGDRPGAEQEARLAADSLAGLPLPRRTQVELLLAQAWTTIGDLDKARQYGRSAARTAGSRGFRPWAIEARLLLMYVTGPEEAERCRLEATELAQQVGASLGEEGLSAYRHQPGYSALWSL